MDEEELLNLNFEDTVTTDNEDGSVDIEFDDVESEVVVDVDISHYENLAELIDEEDLETIGREVRDSYEIDLQSRDNWEELTIEAVDNLGIEYIEDSEPFEGACTATHPLILENSIKFQSKAANELLPSSGPVKTKIIGELNEELEKRASRVRNDMNYQVQHEIPEFYQETERALFFMGFLGNSFKRKAYDPIKDRITDDFYLSDRVVVNSAAKSLMNAERVSFRDFLSKRELDNLIDSGYYRDLTQDELGEPYALEPTKFEDRIREIQGLGSLNTAFNDIYETIEQQCYLQLNEETMCLDEEILPRPYIVTIEKDSEEVLAIRRNWSEDDLNYTQLEWITHYGFIPTAGFYSLGYCHILGNLQRTITLAMRSLADAGQFANLPAGFKLNSRILDDDEPVGFGEFKDVEVPTMVDDIRKIFMPLPFQEPSQVLHMLMNDLIAIGQKFADSTEQVIADSTNYGPVGTTMALLEASTRFFAAVYKRAYNAQAHEFKIIARLVYDYLDDEYPYPVGGDQQYSRREDYDPKTIDIIPVSDPNYSSQAQRVSKANSVMTTAMQSQHTHNMAEVFKYFYAALGVEDELIERFVITQEEPEKREPLDDILAAMRNAPIAAFVGQDHQSHIIMKTSWLQDPNNGGNEMLGAVRPAIEANIREHMFLKYSEEVKAVQAQEQLSIEQAAQRIARLNQIAAEEEQEGSPAYILAKAEELRAITAEKKERRESQQDQYKLGLETIGKAIEMEDVKNKAKTSGRKLDQDMLKYGIDLLKTGYPEASEGGKPKKKDE